MSVNAQNILVAGPDQATTGAISTAPLGTTQPTDLRAELPAAFTSAGYISENGLTLTVERSTGAIKDWSLAVVRSILEEFNGTLAWEYLEWNRESLRVWAGGDNVSVEAPTATTGEQITVAIGADELERQSFLFRMKDGNKRVMIWVPDGQITEQGEVSFTKSGAAVLPVTLTTYPDADGKNLYIVTDDGVFSA